MTPILTDVHQTAHRRYSIIQHISEQAQLKYLNNINYIIKLNWPIEHFLFHSCTLVILYNLYLCNDIINIVFLCCVRKRMKIGENIMYTIRVFSFINLNIFIHLYHDMEYIFKLCKK